MKHTCVTMNDLELIREVETLAATLMRRVPDELPGAVVNQPVVA